MGTFNLNSTLHLLLVLFSIACCSSQSIPKNPIADIACSLVKCGQGNCKDSNASLLGFDCECFPGWKKIQIGPLTFPSCVLPNCTVDFHCGSGSPSPPPPPAPLLPPPLNLSDPCGLTWCGEGSCVAEGSGHACQCNQGSANLMNNPEFACFKECSLGGDCEASHLTTPSPPSPNSGSPVNAPSNEPTPAPPNSSTKLRALITLLVLPAAFTFTWL